MKTFHYLCNVRLIKMEDINRIKVVLVEKKHTSKWLAEQMGVSKWRTNSPLPDLASLLKITDLLKIDIKELPVRGYKQDLLLNTENKIKMIYSV